MNDRDYAIKHSADERYPCDTVLQQGNAVRIEAEEFGLAADGPDSWAVGHHR
jgi:hypothetical protein